jgi:hypothetical protein
MRLSDQAMGALMLALQKCLMEQTDITDILKDFTFQMGDNEELVINNPPVLHALPSSDEKNFTVGSD